MTNLIFVAMAWFVGGFINGMTGFGAAMVAMPLVTPFMDITFAVPACALIVLALNCQLGWIFRDEIRWSHVKEIFIGAAPGVILSAWALNHLPENYLKAGMGLFIGGYAIISLFCNKPRKKGKIHPVWGYLAGILSSSLGMAFGFNGPPLVIYAAYSGWPARAVKGMLGAGFIITGVFIVSAKAIAGQINHAVLITFAFSAPAAVLGSKLGVKFSSHINENTYQNVLFFSLAIMGFWIAWEALF